MAVLDLRRPAYPEIIDDEQVSPFLAELGPTAPTVITSDTWSAQLGF
jgi:hypothetical protein